MPNEQFTADQLRDKANELRTQLIATLDDFIMRNPTILTQIVMTGQGELLIQFSVEQVGPQMTSRFLDDLKATLHRFAPSQH